MRTVTVPPAPRCRYKSSASAKRSRIEALTVKVTPVWATWNW
jgi:hypothetical protein